MRVLLQVTPLQVTPFYALGFLFFMLLFTYLYRISSLFTLTITQKRISHVANAS